MMGRWVPLPTGPKASVRPLGSFQTQYAILRRAGDERVLAIRYVRLGRGTLERLFGRRILQATWPQESKHGWDESAAWQAVVAGCERAGDLTEAKLNALGLFAMRRVDGVWHVRARPFRPSELPTVHLVGEQGALIQRCLDAMQAMRPSAR